MLHVLVPSYPLTDYLYEGLDQLPGVRLIPHPFGKRSKWKSLLRNIEAYLLWWLPRSWFYEPEHIARLREIQPEDSVLYFAIENRKDLQITRKFVRARRQNIWLWNPIGSYRKSALSRWAYKEWLAQSGLQAWTFDPADAQANGLKLAEQVFRRDEASGPLSPVERDIDLYFVGIDKGRLDDLRRWQQSFDKQRLRTRFHIVADKRRDYSEQDLTLVTRAWMPYRENLALVRRSRCLLELLQGTQSGPTIRSMEALFLDTKLITNNTSIVGCAFYDPSRFFVIGHDRPEGLSAFLNTPVKPAEPGILDKHDIRHWLGSFQ